MNGLDALGRRGFLGLTLLGGLAACGGRGGDAKAKTVRIASIGFFEGGKLQVGGNQSSVLNTKGWLGETLVKRLQDKAGLTFRAG